MRVRATPSDKRDNDRGKGDKPPRKPTPSSTPLFAAEKKKKKKKKKDKHREKDTPHPTGDSDEPPEELFKKPQGKKRSSDE